MKFWIIPVAIVLIKLTLNLSNAVYLHIRHKHYLDWLASKSATSYKVIQQSRSRTIALMKQAGVENVGFPLSQPMGFGQVANMTARVFDQYPSRVQILAVQTSAAFEEAIGTFKGRALDAVNPLYWLSLIVYLPTRLCTALGAKQKSLFPKILQGIYWALGVIASAAFAFAKPHIIAWIKGILENLPG